jgi:transcriptional regulator with XRE-family HTH domain
MKNINSDLPSESPNPEGRKGDPIWCQVVLKSFGIDEQHRELIEKEFNAGLVQSFANEFNRKSNAAFDKMKLTQEKLAYRLGCQRSALNNWPKPGSQLWLLLRHSIVLGLDLSTVQKRPLDLLLDAYRSAFQALKDPAFYEVSNRGLKDSYEFSRRVIRLRSIDVLTLLVSLCQSNESNDEETDFDRKNMLEMLMQNVERDWDSITAEINEKKKLLAGFDKVSIGLDQVKDTIRDFFYPMLIVMSVMFYEWWEYE